jgi:hypothetical protein
MLFVYPVAATRGNWLHDTVIAMLEAIHAKVDSGEQFPAWPQIVPAAHRSTLSARRGLRDRLTAYHHALNALDVEERNRIHQCFLEQNRLEDLLSCTSNCEVLQDLAESIRPHIIELFDYAYSLLGELEIRDRQYQYIYVNIQDHICPFCGYEYFGSPELVREDLDHYLAKSLYPFAGANLRNLSPMGNKCNRAYKLQQDILRDAAGNRRRAFFPYAAAAGVQISIDRSLPFEGTDGRLPLWQIDFLPDSPEAQTWDTVFKIRTRYCKDILDPQFSSWLRSFSDWFVRRFGAFVDNQHFIDAMQRYVEDLHIQRAVGREHFRVLVFEMLVRQCTAGNQRLLQFMRDLISPTPAAIA